MICQGLTTSVANKFDAIYTKTVFILIDQPSNTNMKDHCRGFRVTHNQSYTNGYVNSNEIIITSLPTPLLPLRYLFQMARNSKNPCVQKARYSKRQTMLKFCSNVTTESATPPPFTWREELRDPLWFLQSKPEECQWLRWMVYILQLLTSSF